MFNPKCSSGSTAEYRKSYFKQNTVNFQIGRFNLLGTEQTFVLILAHFCEYSRDLFLNIKEINQTIIAIYQYNTLIHTFIYTFV